MEDVERSSAEANLAFIAQMQLLEGLSSGYNQAFQGARDMGLINDDLAEKLIKVKGAMDLTIGTMKIYKTLSEALTLVNFASLIPSLIGVAFAASAVALAYLSVNAETERQRRLFSVLTGVSVGLAAAQFTLAAANASAWITAAGPSAPLMAGIIFGSLAAMGTYLASSRQELFVSPGDLTPEGQTSPGTTREIEETGRIVAHRGEFLTRPGSVSPMISTPGRQTGDVTLVLQGVYNLDTVNGLRKISSMMSRGINQQLNAGSGILREVV